jgi:hypothetical protein
MKWNRLGKVFDPTTYYSNTDYVGYAQSPQALELSDRIRIYFSIRKRDDSGKFISHIAFVEFDKNFESIITVSKHEVIEMGKLGEFDEHGIFPICPFFHNGIIYAYTCGWSRRVSVSVETSTGLAFSTDKGLTFKKQGTGPVLGSSLHEPFLVGDSFVRVYQGVFHMWYIFGTHWLKPHNDSTPERVYKIAHATSLDGVNWNRNSNPIIQDVLGEFECQALPSVVEWQGRYHMIFCYRNAFKFRTSKEDAYRLGYAYSDDMIHWTRDDGNLGLQFGDDWDSDMMCYPHWFRCDDKLYLLYNGNDFGRYGFGLAVLKEW